MAVTDTYSDVCAEYAHWMGQWPAKVLAREFGVSESAAKKWRAGVLPDSRHLVLMVNRWGAAFTEAVFAPAYRRSESNLLGKIQAVKILSEQIEHETSRMVRLGAFGLADSVDHGAVRAGAGARIGASDAAGRAVSAKGQVVKRAIKGAALAMMLAAGLATSMSSDPIARVRVSGRSRIETVAAEIAS